MRLRHALFILLLLMAVALVPAPVSRAQTDNAAAAVRSMLAALGGKSFLAVSEIQSTGKFFTFKRDRLSSSDVFVDYIRFPDKERQEFGTYRIKPTVINAGDSGWNVNDKKIEPQSAADVKEFQAGFKTGFQYVARFVLNRPDMVLQAVSSEMVEFKRNDVVEFRDSGNFFRLFIDQQSHFPTKLVLRRSGESFMREEQFANWHEFQGIQTPMYIIHFKDGEKSSEIRFDNVSYNPGLADSLFAPPIAR
jgi:hypothetical protein